jgi:2-polyprenyl-3-methyl-5-hydroxy-6-metoxy-1,4-benzoquinol methylase
VPAIDYKRAAVEQWTADPCGEGGTEHPPGSRPYIEELLRARLEHAPWMVEALDYRGAADLAVLDVGCGQGMDVIQYARAGRGARHRRGCAGGGRGISPIPR